MSPVRSDTDAYRPLRLSCLGVLVMASLMGCLAPLDESAYQARILRTQGGIPHIRADDLGSLGFGTLFAMAEDNLCILADQYLTFSAERALHLGAGEQKSDLQSDFFYQWLIDQGHAAAPLPENLERIFVGAAAGYNDYLRRTSKPPMATDPAEESEPGAIDTPADPRCRNQNWVREIDSRDMKRVSRADYALAYMQPILVAAAPPDPDAEASVSPPPSPIEIATAVARYLEVPGQGGSNGVAIGKATAHDGRSLLLANPHMPWNEPFQRFYPMHQTIPGEFDVMGANLIGRPRVGFGYTKHVAWTSTVSTAKRLTFYRLELDPQDPTRYVFEGRSRPMRRHVVTVRVRSSDAKIESRSHTFYSTHFGAMLVESPFFPWNRQSAFAVRLVDAGWRSEIALAEEYRARSVRELKAVHDRWQFLPVNLIAADHTGEVLYADPGPIPNLPDELVETCSVLHGAALDGTREECQWQNDPEAVVPGIFGPEKLPSLFRDDYVTNSNDSYWLANPAAPLTGYARTLGREGTPRTLRTRSGLSMLRRASKIPGGITLAALQNLANENEAGRLIRDDLVRLCRTTAKVRTEKGRQVDLARACDVLAKWDLHANLQSRGEILFRRFLKEAAGPKYPRWLPTSFIPRIPFDPDDPVSTPRGLDAVRNRDLLRVLARAILSLEDAGIALDTSLGDVQHVTRNGERIAIHGGPESEGVFNKVEASFRGAEGYPDVDRASSSWILAVEFDAKGPTARGLLTYSLSANPASAHFSDQTRMYSRKEWLELPFREQEVDAAALRDYTIRETIRESAR